MSVPMSHHDGYHSSSGVSSHNVLSEADLNAGHVGASQDEYRAIAAIEGHPIPYNLASINDHIHDPSQVPPHTFSGATYALGTDLAHAAPFPLSQGYHSSPALYGMPSNVRLHPAMGPHIMSPQYGFSPLENSHITQLSAHLPHHPTEAPVSWHQDDTASYGLTRTAVKPDATTPTPTQLDQNWRPFGVPTNSTHKSPHTDHYSHPPSNYHGYSIMQQNYGSGARLGQEVMDSHAGHPMTTMLLEGSESSNQSDRMSTTSASVTSAGNQLDWVGTQHMIPGLNSGEVGPHILSPEHGNSANDPSEPAAEHLEDDSHLAMIALGQLGPYDPSHLNSCSIPTNAAPVDAQIMKQVLELRQAKGNPPKQKRQQATRKRRAKAASAAASTSPASSSVSSPSPSRQSSISTTNAYNTGIVSSSNSVSSPTSNTSAVPSPLLSRCSTPGRSNSPVIFVSPSEAQGLHAANSLQSSHGALSPASPPNVAHSPSTASSSTTPNSASSVGCTTSSAVSGAEIGIISPMLPLDLPTTTPLLVHGEVEDVSSKQYHRIVRRRQTKSLPISKSPTKSRQDAANKRKRSNGKFLKEDKKNDPEKL